MEAIVHELNQVGIKTIGGQEKDKQFGDDVIIIKTFNEYEMDPDVGAVLVGLD